MKFLHLYLDLWCVFSSLLHSMRNNDLVSIFHLWSPILPMPLLKRICFFTLYCCSLFQESDDYTNVSFFLGLLFYSIVQHACFCASSMLILLLLLCHTFKNQAWWYLQPWSFLCRIVLVTQRILCFNTHFRVAFLIL